MRLAVYNLIEGDDVPLWRLFSIALHAVGLGVVFALTAGISRNRTRKAS